MKEQKAIIRKEILKLRNLLSEDELLQKSFEIIEGIKALEEYKFSRLLMCYVDFNHEVMTKGFMDQCIKEGKRVLVPFVTEAASGRKEMNVAEVSSVDNDLEKGTYGILEPKKSILKIIEPDEIDLIIVPGVVFDLKGYRIGYGAGYYDRFLKRVRPNCIKIGAAFELQLRGQIPVDEHDIPVDILITEKRIIKITNNKIV